MANANSHTSSEITFTTSLVSNNIPINSGEDLSRHIRVVPVVSTENKTTYDDMLKKQTFGKMLNLDPCGAWDIVSESEDLAMIHHKLEADMNVYGTVRGVVLDTKVGNVVSYSFPHANKFVAPVLSVTDGRIILDANTSCDANRLKIKIGFEGPLIQIFKHGNKVYHATRKRLESGKSRWGNSKTFDEIYKELDGPSDDVLFSKDKKYSPYVHTFIMNHPDVLICTKDNVGKGNLIYLGPKQMYPTDENCPYPLDEVDTELHVPNTVSSYDTNSENKQIYSPECLTLEEANKHLLFGFYEGFEGYQFLDSRLLPGEFLILEDTEFDMMYRIESPAYAWRCSMRNNNPNFLHRMFELLDYAYLKNNSNDDKIYHNMFPILTFYSSSSLNKTIANAPIIVWPQNTEIVGSVPVNKDDKLYNIWQCFLASVPVCRQSMVVTFHDYLVMKRGEVIAWLLNLSKQNADISTYSKRVQDILVKTRSFAVDKIRRGENFDKKSKVVKNLDFLIAENIRNFISKEIGSSLYRIIREMDKLQSETK